MTNQNISEIRTCAPSIIFGKVIRKFTRISIIGKPRFEEAQETKQNIQICECNLPILKEKDEVYISEYKKNATITKVTSYGTDGKIHYYTTFVLDYVDEIEKTRDALKEQLELALDEYYKKESEEQIEKKVNTQAAIYINNELMIFRERFNSLNATFLRFDSTISTKYLKDNNIMFDDVIHIINCFSNEDIAITFEIDSRLKKDNQRFLLYNFMRKTPKSN